MQPAFYYWKSKVDISPREKAYLDQLCVEKIYLRFFDVDWNPRTKRAVPISSVRLDMRRLAGKEMVPTIYITSRTLQNISIEGMVQLAKQIHDKILHIAKGVPIKEVQFDCDWPETEQDKYFHFLKAFRAHHSGSDLTLTSTIRLHQLKYFTHTGVPPVDKGMLMFYNMGDLPDIHANRTILNMELVEEYLTNFELYPLELDVALPLFSWGIVIREKQSIHLLNYLHSDQLEDTRKFKFLDPELVHVTKGSYLNGYYLQEGDIIRIEQVPIDHLMEAAELLAPLIQSDSVQISFYHLDTPTINRYTHQQLNAICRLFD